MTNPIEKLTGGASCEATRLLSAGGGMLLLAITAVHSLNKDASFSRDYLMANTTLDRNALPPFGSDYKVVLGREPERTLGSREYAKHIAAEALRRQGIESPTHEELKTALSSNFSSLSDTLQTS